MTMEHRAVLECFYGPLWNPSQRSSVLATAARHGATDYVYGPAADPRTGAHWRIPYDDEAAPLEQLVADASALGLATTWRVSPGAPLERDAAMVMDSEEELTTLLRRIREIAGIGFKRILLAFDDIDAAIPTSTAAHFGHDAHPLAAAHAHVGNACHEVTDELGIELLMCPTEYWGTGASLYRRRLGELLNPDVEMCWTGPSVTSRTVTAEEALVAREQYQHPLWLWDNHPVNDWAWPAEKTSSDELVLSNDIAPQRPPLAPLARRDPALIHILHGYGANCAVDPVATQPALASCLDWAGDPHAYSPRRSMEKGWRELGLEPPEVDALLELAPAMPPTLGGGSNLMGDVAGLLANHDSRSASRIRSQLHEMGPALRSAQRRFDTSFADWLAEAARQVEQAAVAAEVFEGQGPLGRSLLTLLNATPGGSEHNVLDGMLWVMTSVAKGLRGAGEPGLP